MKKKVDWDPTLSLPFFAKIVKEETLTNITEKKVISRPLFDGE
jgi:hypothetical protein